MIDTGNNSTDQKLHVLSRHNFTPVYQQDRRDPKMKTDRCYLMIVLI